MSCSGLLSAFLTLLGFPLLFFGIVPAFLCWGLAILLAIYGKSQAPSSTPTGG